MGVLKLDVPTFEAIENDPSATTQAAIIVAVVGILSAIGAAIGATAANSTLSSLQSQLGSEFQMPLDIPTLSPLAAGLNALVGAFVAWLLWSFLTYFIGTRLFDGEADLNEMLRVVGYGQVPRLLSVFAFIPCIGAILGFVGWVWALVATFIGIRQGLDIDNGKTFLTVAISFVVVLLVNFLILAPLFALLS
jgi:hypothetical protein